jgi:hypothetical protein
MVDHLEKGDRKTVADPIVLGELGAILKRHDDEAVIRLPTNARGGGEQNGREQAPRGAERSIDGETDGETHTLLFLYD